MVAKLGSLVERAAQGLGVALEGRAAADLTAWLDNPFGTPPLVPLAEQLSLELS